jgi:hypothetical protein
MLKPYKDRVYSTIAVLETTLEFIFHNAAKLRELNRDADQQTNKLYEEDEYLPVAYDNTDKYEIVNFKGYDYYWDSSEVSGTQKLVYTKHKKDFQIKYFDDVIVKDSIKVAKGYYIPPEYSYLVDKLRLHGVEPSFLLSERRKVLVTRYKFKNVIFSSTPYEGRQTVTFNYDKNAEQEIIPEGSYFYLTNQRTARILTHLLEPKSADSFVQWGFMNQIFEQKEYYEDYVMEKIAEQMLENDFELKKEFEEKLKSDEAFRSSSKARLDFFYERSPYPDKQLNVYPILRVE